MTSLPRRLFEYIIYYHCLVATASALIAIFIVWSVNDWIPPMAIAIVYLCINILFAIYMKVALDQIPKLRTYVLYEVISFLLIILLLYFFTFFLIKHIFCIYIFSLYILICVVIPLIFKFGYALLFFPKCWWSRPISTSFQTEGDDNQDSSDHDKPPTYTSLDEGLPEYDEI